MIDRIFAIADTSFGRQLGAPSRPQPSAVEQHGSTLILKLVGALSRDGRLGGSSTDALRSQLQTAASDGSVGRVVIRVDSPGGESAGAVALSDAVEAMAKVKPVVAMVENMAASAAYLAIAKASKIVASRGAMIGSIGTYAVIEDVSALADAVGVKVHVVKAGEFKAIGVPGTPFTETQQREVQRIVNDINALFLGAVATGRRLKADELARVSDGRAWLAADALRFKLIDEIGDLASVLSSPVAAASGSDTRRGMSAAADFHQRFQEQQGIAIAPASRSGAIHLR